MKSRLLSVLLVFLLLASVSIPAVSAIPTINAQPAVCLAPAAVKFVVDGITVGGETVTSLESDENLGKTWNRAADSWGQLMNETGAALDNLFNAKK